MFDRKREFSFRDKTDSNVGRQLADTSLFLVVVVVVVIQNTAMRIALGAFKSSPVTTLQTESSLSSLSHRRSTLLVRTYTKLASSPSCHILHSLLLRQSRAPLLGSLPYQAHTPFIERALSFFASFQVTPPPFSLSRRLPLWALGFPSPS